MGLHAAWQLEQRGFKVVVIEARGRVGGRLLTFSDVQGRPEAGGNIIYGDYQRLMAVAEARRRRARRPGAAPVEALEVHAGARRQAGQPLEWADSPRNPFPPALREMMPWQYVPLVTSQENPLASPAGWYDPKYAAYDVSMRDFLRKQGATDEMIKLAYDTIPTYGLDARDISALMMAYVSAFTQAQKVARPVMLQAQRRQPAHSEAMAAQLRQEVRLSQVVKAIEASDAGVVVRTQGRRPLPGARRGLRVAVHDAAPHRPRAGTARAHRPCAVKTAAVPADRPGGAGGVAAVWQDDELEPSMWTDSPLGRWARFYHEDDDDAVSSLPGAGVRVRGPPPRPARRRRLRALRRVADRADATGGERHSTASSASIRGSRTITPAAHGLYYNPGTVTKFLLADAAARRGACTSAASMRR